MKLCNQAKLVAIIFILANLVLAAAKPADEEPRSWNAQWITFPIYREERRPWCIFAKYSIFRPSPTILWST